MKKEESYGTNPMQTVEMNKRHGSRGIMVMVLISWVTWSLIFVPETRGMQMSTVLTNVQLLAVGEVMKVTASTHRGYGYNRD